MFKASRIWGETKASIWAVLIVLSTLWTSCLAAEIVSVPYRDSAQEHNGVNNSKQAKKSSFIGNKMESKRSVYPMLKFQNKTMQAHQLVLDFANDLLPDFIKGSSFDLNLVVDKGRDTVFNQDGRKSQAEYLEYHIAPRLVSQVAHKFNLAVVYDYTLRKYLGRTIGSSQEDADSDHSSLGNGQTVSYTASYPIKSQVSILVQGSYKKQKGVVGAQDNSQQTVSSQHYFAGMALEF